MNCLTCGANISNSKKYCSRYCYDKSKIGRKRPDVSKRNSVNNPIHNPASKEKMRDALTGKKIPAAVRRKMSISHKKRVKNNPEALRGMREGAEEKYLSKVRGTSWRMVRVKALERDNYACTICGESSYRRLLVHHIDWRGKQEGVKASNMNNDLSNLQTLCYKCHNSIHRHKSSDYQDRKARIAP